MARIPVSFFRTFNHDLPAPAPGSEHAIGLDVCAAEGVAVLPGGQAVVSTGWGWAPPETSPFYLRIAPRSGMGIKGIHVMAGVVDPDYRGEIRVALINLSLDYRLDIHPGDRIAQLITEQAMPCEAVVIEAPDETERGANGFGSTGLNRDL